MKKNTLAALILTTRRRRLSPACRRMPPGSSTSGRTLKSAGIKTAVSDFEKQYNVKVNLREMPYAQQLENCASTAGGHWAGRAGDPE